MKKNQYMDGINLITKLEDGRLHIETINNEPTMTQQQFGEDSDINNIMEKYKKTGFLPVTGQSGIYADLTDIPDYKTALETVIHAEEAFMALPSEVRQRFGNDPQKLINFLSEPKNYDEGVKLGLINKGATPQPEAQLQNDLNEIQKQPPSDSMAQN